MSPSLDDPQARRRCPAPIVAALLCAVGCQQLLGIEEGEPAGSAGSAGSIASAGKGSSGGSSGGAGSGGMTSSGSTTSAGGLAGASATDGGAAGEGAQAGAGGDAGLPVVAPPDGLYLLHNSGADACLISPANEGDPMFMGACVDPDPPPEQIWWLEDWNYDRWDLYDQANLFSMVVADTVEDAAVTASYASGHFWEIRQRDAAHFELVPTIARGYCLTADTTLVIRACDLANLHQEWGFVQ